MVGFSLTEVNVKCQWCRRVSTSQRWRGTFGNRHRQSAVAACTGGRRVARPTTAAPTARQVYGSRGRKTLAQALISCCLDYCNSLFYGIVSHEPAIVCPLCSCVWCRALDSTTTSHQCLLELHWLPVRRQMYFKMVTLVYLSLSGMAPAYLAADFQLVFDEGRRQLSSATSRTCGTAFQVICDNLTLAFNDLYGY